MLDNTLLLRKLLIKRTDCLVRTQILYILVAIRYLNKIRDRSNFVSIHILLKNSKRSISIKQIQTHSDLLFAAGYAKRIKTTITITEAGKQALNDLDKQLKQVRYNYSNNKRANKLKPGKPKPII